jgi:hypothetical protein
MTPKPASNANPRRFKRSLLALGLLILTPFGLYFALEGGNDLLAALLFAVLGGAILLVMLFA